MLVIVMIVAVTMAELIFCTIAAALDGVYEVVLAEEDKCPEDVRLVDGHNPSLQLCHDDAVGGGFDTMLFKKSDAVCFVHFVV